jgi:hypothetical protein
MMEIIVHGNCHLFIYIYMCSVKNMKSFCSHFCLFRNPLSNLLVLSGRSRKKSLCPKEVTRKITTKILYSQNCLFAETVTKYWSCPSSTRTAQVVHLVGTATNSSGPKERREKVLWLTWIVVATIFRHHVEVSSFLFLQCLASSNLLVFFSFLVCLIFMGKLAFFI